jgi:hypothetical protein
MNPLVALAGAIAIAAVAVVIMLILLIRSPNLRGLLPRWPARDWRAMIALIASIAGAAVLTWFAWWLVNLLSAEADRLLAEIVRNQNARSEIGAVLVVIIKTEAWGLKLLLIGIIAVLLSLGLAINRRSIRLGKSGLDMSGGEDDTPVPVQVTNPPTAPVPTTEAKP